MAFDWFNFLRRERIFFITEGKNVKRGNINTKCPMCGSQDPSEHMGMDLRTGEWGCWRDPEHRGIDPTRLIQAFLRCSFDHAKSIAEEEVIADDVPVEDLLKRIQADDPTPPRPRARIEVVKYPPDIKPIAAEGARARFLDYLAEDRGFGKDAWEVTKKYDLMCALTGDFAHRLIIPFYFEHSLVGWTGRAIAEAKNRYRSFPESEVVKSIIYNYDKASAGGRQLFIVEGPLDTIKHDFYISRNFDTAVGLLGVAYLDRQISLLLKLCAKFEKIVILLDPNALHVAMRLQASLAMFDTSIANVPSGVEDPGELTGEQSIALADATWSSR